MTQAASAHKAQSVAPLKHPNFFQLQGEGVHISYSTSGLDGKPHFGYQDAAQSLQFSGDELNSVETELGALVTVFIRRTIDAGSTTFTLLVPRVNLRFGDFAPITTLGITAIHQFSIIGPPNGQADFYHSHVLKGDAALVKF